MSKPQPTDILSARYTVQIDRLPDAYQYTVVRANGFVVAHGGVAVLEGELPYVEGLARIMESKT